MDVISYKLPVFEGPLDLLLFLVQKNKLNIYDIPIAEVLEQYMDAIRRMQEGLPENRVFSSCTNVVITTGAAHVSISSSFSSSLSPDFSCITLE